MAMQESDVKAALAGLPLGGLRFFPTIGSTNDEALAWAASGAPDLAAVVADEQISGRGRSGRKWLTPAGAALAFSVVLKPTSVEQTLPGRVTGLAALALVQCCRDLGLKPQIKWPNDLLLNGRKVAGILVESVWAGSDLDSSVVGVGLNVGQTAVPPDQELTFPATSLEAELGRSIDRPELLRNILSALIEWRSKIGGPEFIEAWEKALAFRGEPVSVGGEGERPLNGTLLGLAPDGSLRLLAHDKVVIIHFGEIHLRPRDDRIH